MQTVVLPPIGTAAAWRTEARRLAAAGVRPEGVLWSLGEPVADLFAGAAPQGQGIAMTLKRDALDTIETALWHSDPERFSLAYKVALDCGTGRAIWGDRTDKTQGRLLAMAKAVRRDIHKMHAFVRFRELSGDGRRRFAAWFEPTHFVTEPATPFFAKRFGDMDWVISTPHLTARFIDGKLDYTLPDGNRPPAEDATEALWQTYYANIFNPARLMVRAMQSEMPKKYWHNLPEASLIPDLIRSAPARTRAMQEAEARSPSPAMLRRAAAARAKLPARPSGLPETLDHAREMAMTCTRCPLHCEATQTVWGRGPADAQLMIVGEQPGDHEDLTGKPFVGPAGQLLDGLMQEAGLDRDTIYLTNAVKHFKFRVRGKRRIHLNPSAPEVEHCRWWLDQERRFVAPRVILTLGATALSAVTGDGSDLLNRRGTPLYGEGTLVLPTLHPAYVLRLKSESDALRAKGFLLSDLRQALALVG